MVICDGPPVELKSLAQAVREVPIALKDSPEEI